MEEPGAAFGVEPDWSDLRDQLHPRHRPGELTPERAAELTELIKRRRNGHAP